MKKWIFLLFIVTIISMFSFSSKEVLIPKESIRFRIIASDNSKENQKTKWDISASLVPELMHISQNANSLDSVRQNIDNNLVSIENILKSYNVPYQISFGNNYFPEKKYKGISYEAGEYESLVITLGQGLGDNWWCVMFPPLCLMEAKENEVDEVVYKSYIKDVLNKYFTA